MPDNLLDRAERDALKATLPTWTLEGEVLTREATATAFLGAIAWVDAIAVAAEAADHHPDIDIRWRTVRLALTTHDAGGLTRKDVDLARRIDAILAS